MRTNSFKERAYDMTIDIHELFEDASPRVRVRITVKMTKLEANWKFRISFRRTRFWRM